MRALVVAAVLALFGSGRLQAGPPFEGLDPVEGVYVTIDEYGISLRQAAADWSFYLPDGSDAEWRDGDGVGQAPYVEIACRASGGYSDPTPLRVEWTVPRPIGTPKRLQRKRRRLWSRLWPWTYEEGLDRALSAVVEGRGLVLIKGFGDENFKVGLHFAPNAETAHAARLMAAHCEGR